MDSTEVKALPPVAPFWNAESPSADQDEQEDHGQDSSTRHGSDSLGRARTLLAGLPVTERRLELNGIATAVLEGGDGLPWCCSMVPESTGRLGARDPGCRGHAPCDRPRLPGHGATDAPGCELDPERIMGWLDDLIECTCPTPPVLVGQVLGGAIAARFASERGDRIRGLVLVNALGLGRVRSPPDSAWR